MRKSKDSGSAAPAVKRKDAENEDWKKICKNCDILKKGNNCYYGCEIIKAALRKESKERI